jgi:nucleoside-diphosphate-sugar epimerase
MKILLVGGQSSLAQVLRPVLETFAEVLTAGRNGCDMELDLSWPIERFSVPANVDVLINTVAHFGNNDPDEFLAAEMVNTLGALKLCFAARNAQVKHIVQISSTSACLDDTSKYYGIYSLSKRHSDEVVRLYCATAGLPCVILRPSQLYGDQDSFRKHQPFLFHALDRALRGEDIIIYGSRAALRNYLHAEDFSRIIAAVIQKKIEGTYQCTSPVDVGLDSIAKALLLASASPGKVMFDMEMEDIPDNIFVYDDALFQQIGVYPEIGMEEGITRLVAARLGAQ